MMQQVAASLSSYFVQKGLLREEDHSVYSYCFEVFLSMMTFWGSVLVIALLSQQMFSTFFYLGTFMLFRSVAGGYHEDSHLKCYILSIATYFLFLGFIMILPQHMELYCSVFFGLITVLLILRYAPVDHPNKRFHERERAVYRQRSCCLVAFMAVILLFLWWQQRTAMALYISYGALQAAFSVSIVSWKERGEKK